MKNILFALLMVAVFAACDSSNTVSSEKDNHNPVLDNIYNRKSVRNFHKNRPVAEGDIQLLMQAAMAAPSGRNIQPWEFVIIDDREILDRMADELATARMLSEAPLAIVVCGDTISSFYWYLDCAAATQNLLLAAESLGLGAVWTASYPYPDRMEVVIRNTGLPTHILPLAVIPVGYPLGKETSKNKFKSDKIHRNKW